MITFEGPQCMWTNPSQKSRQGSDPPPPFRQCLNFGSIWTCHPSLTRGRVWEAVCMIGTQLRLAPSPCRWTRKIRHWCHKSLKKYKKLKEDKLSVLQGKHTREHPAYLPWWSRWFGPSSLLSQIQTQTQPGQDQLGWQRFISQMRSLQISVHLSSLELTWAHLWSPVWGSQPIQTSPGSAWSRHPVCR